MTDEQRTNAKSNIKSMGTISINKCVKGVREHGGNLWEKQGMLRNAEDEVADLMQYLPTLRRQLNEVLDLLVNKKYIQAEDKLIDILSNNPN